MEIKSQKFTLEWHSHILNFIVTLVSEMFVNWTDSFTRHFTCSLNDWQLNGNKFSSFFSKYKNIWPGNCSLMSRNEWLRQLRVYRLGMTRFISFEGIVLDRKWFCATQEEGVYSILNPPLLSTSGIRMKIFRLGHGLNRVHHKCFSNYRYWDCTRCV